MLLLHRRDVISQLREVEARIPVMQLVRGHGLQERQRNMPTPVAQVLARALVFAGTLAMAPVDIATKARPVAALSSSWR